MGKSVMYYDDLTKFIYLKFLHPNDLPPDLLNIGWLDSEHVFPTDKIDPLVLPVIKKMVFNERSLHMTRGYYFCPFCTISHPIENHPVPASILISCIIILVIISINHPMFLLMMYCLIIKQYQCLINFLNRPK